MITLALVTYNQAELLRNFLENYRRFGKASVPLLVVDDGSTDATAELLKAAASSSSLRCFRVPHGGSAQARNEALRRCETPWIAFSDTDCILDAEYFRRVVEIPARYAEYPAVEGAVVPPSGPKPAFTHSLFNASGGTYATANMAFKVKTLLGLGGFDERFPAAFREDSDLALTLLKSYGPIPFWAEWKVCHPHLPREFWPALTSAWSKQNRMLTAEMLLHAKHPSRYGRIRRHPRATSTLANWCLHWSWLYLRECGAYLATRPPRRGQAYRLCAEAALVAAWEQICIAGWCLWHWKTLRRAASV